MAVPEEIGGSMSEPMSFADALIGCLAKRSKSQQYLADQLDVTRASVNDWCRGRAIPSAETVFAIEDALEVGPGDLSRTLGYVPADAVPPTTVPECIAADPRLSDRDRRALILLYEELTRDY